MKNNLLIALGWLSVALGTIGIFLPVMPTTPFFVFAAFVFSKSSPRFHQWVLDRPGVGPLVDQWEKTGSIPFRAKWFASITLLIGMSGSLLLFPLPDWMPWVFLVVAVGVLSFLWTRPSA